MRLIILLLLTFNTAFAQDIIPIKKGQPSPIDGFVISKKANEKIIEDREKLERKNIQLKDLSVLQDQSITDLKSHRDTLSRHNAELRESLRAKPTGFWQKTGYFVLGALITGAIGYGTVRALR